MSVGYETPNPGQQPEQLAAPTGIWPPPPIFEPEVTTAFPFSAEMRMAEGSVPEFREGILIFSDHGLLIQGKAVLLYEIQVLVMLASVLILAPSAMRPACMIVFLIMDWAFRRDEEINVSYQDVSCIVLNAARRQVCVVYDAPNYRGTVKRHSLTTQLEQDEYHAFLAAAEPHMTGKIAAGQTRLWISPVVWLTLVYMMLLGVFLTVTSNIMILDSKFHWKM